MRKNNANGTELNYLADIVPLDMPLSLAITPSNVCNLKCNYCYHGSKQKAKDIENGNFKPIIMDMETINLIVEQCQAFPRKFKQITLVGWGEPLVNKNIAYIVREMKKVTEKVKLVTNGALLTHELSMELIDSGLDCIKISFQGMTNVKYKKICDTDVSVNDLIKQIKFFYEHRGKCQVHIKVVDAALDHEEESAFLELFNSISDQAWVEHISEVDQRGQWTTVDNRWQTDVGQAEVCYFPFYYMFIDEYKNIYPCCNNNKNMIIGNMDQKSLKDLWNEEIYSLCISQLKNEKRDYPACIGCKVMPTMMRAENYLDDKKNEILDKMEGK